MHLAVVTACPPSRRTLTEYGEHLIRALASKPEVSRLSVICDRTDGAELEWPAKVSLHRTWRFNDALNAWRIARRLEALRPDGVIFNLQFASFGDQRVPAALGLLAPGLVRNGLVRNGLMRRGTSTITLLHNIMETVDLERAGFGGHALVQRITRLAGRAFTRALLASDLVATTMPRYVDLLRDQYGAKNVFLAPHGAFHATEAPPLPTGRVVMTFGKFGTYKTVEPLLEAHARLLERDPNVRLVIAGGDSPNAQGYLENARANYAHLPNVTFTGYVPEERVPEVFRDCTVVAFPYNSTTGSSGVLHQAGQYARAAVMPRIGDLADLIEDEGYRAEFFTPNDPESLAEALWRVLETPERALELGLANHAAASGLLLEDVADWYVLHLERLNNRRGKVARPSLKVHD